MVFLDLQWVKMGCAQLWFLYLGFYPSCPVLGGAKPNQLQCHWEPGQCPAKHTHSFVTLLYWICCIFWIEVLYWPNLSRLKKNVGVAYREELAKELGNAWKCSTLTFILWQAAAQQPQSALPHFDSQGASRGEKLGAPVVLHVPYAQWLHCRWLRTGVAQWVKHKQHAQRRKQQNDPADVRTKVKKNAHSITIIY